jgi:hypothetical protein
MSRQNKSPTDVELAFWEWAEPYTGMNRYDMEKSSHGRAFMAGWEAAIKNVTVHMDSEKSSDE